MNNIGMFYQAKEYAEMQEPDSNLIKLGMVEWYLAKIQT
jgi:hypothetical protein